MLLMNREKINLLNRLDRIEIRLEKVEAAICRATEVEPEDMESVITLIDLQVTDEIKDGKKA